MSTPVQQMVEDIDRKIANLTDLRKNLLQFEQDFPHSAASLQRMEKSPGAKPATKRKYTRRKKAAKKTTDRQTDRQTEQAACRR